MKIRLIATAALLTLASAIPVTSSAMAQRYGAQEIRFPRGATAVTLEGRAGHRARIYTFRAMRGQVLRIRMDSRADDVSAELFNGRGRPIASTSDDGRLWKELPYSGNYTIEVSRRGYGRSDGDGGYRPSFYTMRVSIR